MSTFKAPNLDDRTFADLLGDAMTRAQRSCPEWTDRSAGDPGVVLLELFSYLTETMLYRLNRLPEKVYMQLLRLLGVRLIPPAAARAVLRFSREGAGDRPIVVPRGTRVTVGRPGADRAAPVFVTLADATLPPEGGPADVSALHCEIVESEQVGVTTGRPGQVVFVQKPPIIAPSGDALDLIVGVEATETEIGPQVRTVSFDSRPFIVWREVESFAEVGESRFAVVVDRGQGRIDFPPEMVLGSGGVRFGDGVIGAVPSPGREIRVWYRRGGGAAGNVNAGTLTALSTPIPKVRVTNPEPATGGAAAEAIENALRRAPHEFRSVNRAVTADDYERLARSVPSVARARAFTSARYWAHAPAGSVDLVIVPMVPDGQTIDANTLRQQQTPTLQQSVVRVLEERCLVGSRCAVRWPRFKPVAVDACVVIFREGDRARIAESLKRRLSKFLSPLPLPSGEGGWPFGQELRVSSVYEAIQAEPGVRFVDRLRLIVDDVPSGVVPSIAGRSPYRPNPWYAAAGDRIFRSTDDGQGWELSASWPGETVLGIELSPDRPGLAGAFTRLDGKDDCRLYITEDAGASWRHGRDTDFLINDIAWSVRGGENVLLAATERGLFELSTKPDAVLMNLSVAKDKPDLGFSAVAVFDSALGGKGVAVAARQLRGIYVSVQEGKTDTYQTFGLTGQDVAALEVQSHGPQRFLWAGVAAEQGEPGQGCARRQLQATVDAAAEWAWYSKGWTAGSCRALAFGGGRVFAGTHRSGVLRLDWSGTDPAWQGLDLSCGLPLREADKLLQPVEAVACDEAGRTILAGGPKGVYRSVDGGNTYVTASSRESSDRVTIAEDALLCSGQHQIKVVTEDEFDAMRR